MSKKVFKLSDFDSRACDIEMEGADGKSVLKLSLRKFTLLDRIWVEREFGSLQKWETTLFPTTEDYSESEWLEALLKTFHHLLEPEVKKDYESWENLAETFESTVEVLLGLQKALLYVLRGSEPLIEKFEQEVKKNMNPTAPKAKKKTKRKIGRK